MKILAVLALGTLPAGCGRHQADAEHQIPVYDLGPDSNLKFLADNAAKKGVVRLPDGLQYRIIQNGQGKSPASPDDIVTVSYKGWLINNKVFDETPAGRTASFPVGRLIPGWVQALSMMKAGDEWELIVPADLGYGADGAGDAVPPNQTLVFDMKLLSIAPAQ